MVRPTFLGLLAPLLAASLLGIPADAHAQEEAGPAQPTAELPPLPPPAQQEAQPQIVIQQYSSPIIIQQGPATYQGPVYSTGYAPGYVPPQPSTGETYRYHPNLLKDWTPDEPVPDGYHVVERPRGGLIAGGAVMFGTMYLLTAMGASVVNDNGGTAGALYVPGLGPFIQMAQSNSSTASFFLAVDGLAQLGGIAMFVAGFASPKKVLAPNVFGMHLELAPVVAKGTTGMGLAATF